MDYNIKFEYKGLGKQVQGTRQKAIQQSKKIKEDGITTPVKSLTAGKKDPSSAIYSRLNNSITKLTASNEKIPKVAERKDKDVPGTKKRETIPQIKKAYVPKIDLKKATVKKPLSDKNIGMAPISKLNTSITKLIASNEKLTKATEKRASGVGIGGGGGGGGSHDSGITGMGASIPLGIGAAVAALGFTMGKINQIGTAYIEKVSEQLPGVGIAGFRTKGEGIYTANQLGAGMRAHAMATGRFADVEAPSETALRVGAIHGLSAEETLRTAGQFKRAGANYEQAANVAAGTGIQSELPILLTSMADMMTEAVKEGVNTSDIANDMAKEIAALTMTTPGKSVEAALNMVKSFQGIQQGLTRGKVQGAQGLYTTEAAQTMLMRKITGQDLEGNVQKALSAGYISKEQATKMSREDYAKRLQDQGFISKEQADKMSKIGPGANFAELMKNVPGAAFPLLRKFTAETSPVAMQRETMQLASQRFGKEPESRQRFYDFAMSQGWAESQSQMESLLKNNTIEPAENIENKGKDLIDERSKKVEYSPAGLGIKQIQQREALVFKAGQQFAETALKMDKVMLSIAEKGAPLADKGMRALGDECFKLAGIINGITTNKVKVPSVSVKTLSFSEFLDTFHH
jgi:hypothetical protein